MFSAEPEDVLRGGEAHIRSGLGSNCKECHEHTHVGDDLLKNHGFFPVISIIISTSFVYA